MSVCQGRSPLPAESLRRLSVITEPEETISRLKSAPRLRALLGFNFTSNGSMYLYVGGLKLIRVIDLQKAYNLEVLPKEIGGLVNLRYLSLQNTLIYSLPETIKNLSRLQLLNVQRTPIKKFTSDVWEIETLRQVFFPHGALAPNRVQCRWRSLQVLRWPSDLYPPDWMDDTLHKVKDIKTLEIWRINASHHAVLSLNLPQFSRLKILILMGRSIPRTALTLSGLPRLRTLVLVGPISRGPIKSTSPEEVRPEDIPGSPRGLSCLCGLIKSTFPEEVRAADIPGSLRGLSCHELTYGWPAGLTCLELHFSELHRDPLPSLGQLSELRFLTLARNGYSWGEEMKFRGDEFKQLQELKLQYDCATARIIVEDGAMPHLQKLKISHLDQLEIMTVEDGAMPHLQKLKISNCPRLKTIPRRLEDLAEWKDRTTSDFEWQYSF